MFIPPPPSPDPPPAPQPATSADALDDDQLRSLTAYVVDCLNHGSKPADIRTSLLAKDLSEDEADTILNQVLAHRGIALDASDFDVMQQLGRRNMMIGGAVCALGLIVTCGTLAAGGSHVVIAWGAIIWGFIQFARGMSQINQSRQ